MIRAEVDYAGPIPMPVIEEVCQLLGYSAGDVTRISLDPDRVTVVTWPMRDRLAGLEEVMHVHVVGGER